MDAIADITMLHDKKNCCPPISVSENTYSNSDDKIEIVKPAFSKCRKNISVFQFVSKMIQKINMPGIENSNAQ